MKSTNSCASAPGNVETRLFVGPAGWSYDDWEGTVYPPGVTRAGKRLEYIVKRFNLIEVDATFYRLPTPRTVERWAQVGRLRKSFRFTVKAPGAVTHEGRLGEAVTAPFKDILSILRDAGLLGTVLYQFPASFRCEPAQKVLLRRILDCFEGFPATVEVRRAEWDTPAYRDYLRGRGVAFCNIDLPDTGSSLPLTEYVTAPWAYLRLHGRNRPAWLDPAAGRDQRFDWLYGPGEVDCFAGAARRLAESAAEVYVVTNNHYRGKAITNARQIAEALELDLGGGPDFPLLEPPGL